MSANTIPPRIRQIVLERDNHCCQRCGRYIFGGSYSLQHRRAKGHGGSKAFDTNLPGNLVTVCGHATEPGGCHLWAESCAADTYSTGYRVRQGANPTGVPILTYTRGWVLLDNEGLYEEVTAP